MNPPTVTIHGTVVPLTPIHIGTGQEWTPIDLLMHGQEILVCNPEAVFAAVPVTAQERFIALCAQRNANLTDILKQVNATIPDAAVISRYRAPPNWTPRGSIRRFIATQGNPYLPGSSLKGTLRTALLDSWLTRPGNMQVATDLLQRELDDIRRRFATGGRKVPDKVLTNFGESLEERVFGGTPNDSLMRYITVRDSPAVGRPALQLELVRSELIGGERASLPSTVYLETIVPDTSFVVEMTVDTAMPAIPSRDRARRVTPFFPETTPAGIVKSLREMCNARAAYILQMEEEFYRNREEETLASSIASIRQDFDQHKAQAWYFPIGFASGYVAVTVGLRLQEASGCWDAPECAEECNPRKVGKLFCQVKDLLRIDPNPQGQLTHRVNFPVTRRLIIRKNAPAAVLGWCKFTPNSKT